MALPSQSRDLGQEMIIASSGSRTRERQETCSNKPRHLRPVRGGAQEQDLTHEKLFVFCAVLASACDMGGGKW